MERVSARIAARPGAPGATVRPPAEREQGRPGREPGGDERGFEQALAGRPGAPAADIAEATRARARELDVGAAPDEEPGAHLDLTA